MSEAADMRAAIERVRDTLAGASGAGDHPRHDVLDRLVERLGALSPQRWEGLKEGAAHLHGTLVHLEQAGPAGALGLRERRDLRTIVRCVGAILDWAEVPGPVFSPHRAPAMHYQRLDLRAFVLAATEAFAPLATRRGISLETDAGGVPLEVDADVERLERVLLNLLFNAFKYTPRGGRIRVALRDEAADEQLELTVADSGAGIPPTQADAVFEHARVVDRTSSAALPGLGFGLGNSRFLAALHGGTLDLAPPGATGGCVFRLVLPRHAPQGVTPGTPAPAICPRARGVADAAARELEIEEGLATPATPDGRPLVLVVEDSRSTQRVIVECLADAYNTACAFDGAEGLAEAIRLRPDLVLVDLVMPRMDGESLIRAMRSRADLVETPVLVLTADADPARVVQLLDGRAQDVLRKPFLVAEVRARVTGLVAAKRARDILRETAGRQEANLIALADEVGRQQRQLAAALDEVRVARDLAQRASRTKSTFLRMMSHELKTPVTAMTLQLRTLESELGGNPPGRSRDILSRVNRSTRRLLHLVDTVIEWARVESGRMHVEPSPVDAAALFTEVTAELDSYARDKGVTVQLSVPPPGAPAWPGDPRILRVLLTTLLSHALQRTPRGTIAASLAMTDGGGLHVKVLDGGAPREPAHREELFAPLEVDGDVSGRAGTGSGLGLNVVRDIARALGGDVELGAPGDNPDALLLRLPPLVPAGVPP